jgi:hypothetical protein
LGILEREYSMQKLTIFQFAAVEEVRRLHEATAQLSALST